MDLNKALDSVRTVKLTGGIFGKTTLLLVVLCICVAAVAIRVAIWWLVLVLLLPTMGIIFYALKRVLDFAEKNPQAAIMDGAEFLTHERIVYGRKGEKMVADQQESTTDHPNPPLDESDVEKDDPDPKSLSENASSNEEKAE